MEDIRRQDLRLWAKEFLEPMSLLGTAVFLGVAWLFFNGSLPKLAVAALAILFLAGMRALGASIDARFYNQRHRALWKGCQDRYKRFEEALKRMRKDQVADLREMPDTIKRILDSLYLALRRADIIVHEVSSSERGLFNSPPAWSPPTTDPQSQELYRIADKNLAEYKQQFAAVMAGVDRAEAQAAVFMTTVDTLRMKMLGYRLVGKSPEMASYDLLESLAEARAQLDSIDRALDELDLGHYPKNIAVVPPNEGPEELRH